MIIYGVLRLRPGTVLIVVIGVLGTLMPLLSCSFAIIGRRSQTFINKQTQKPRPERKLSFLKDREGECWVAEVTEGLSEKVAFEQNLERREVGSKCELHVAVGSLFHKSRISIVYLTLQPKINITHKDVTHQVSKGHFKRVSVAGGSRLGRWSRKLFASWAYSSDCGLEDC